MLYPLDDLPETENGWGFWKRLREVEKLDSDALVDLQTAQLKHLLAHHAQHTAQFQKRLKDAELNVKNICSLKDLIRLPILKRADVQTAGPALFSSLVPFDHLPIRAARTSGSTGQPVVVRRTRFNTLLNEAATLRDHAWWERPQNGGRITMIRPQFSKTREVSATPGNATNIAQQIPITTDIAEQSRLIEEFQPQVLLVYPNNLAALLELWAKGNAHPNSLRHIKTIGETVTPALRDRAKSVLGLPIEDGYSSEEMGTIALQCPASGWYHTMAESHHVEVLRENGSACEPGELGRVVVTDLHNLATPMIRYDIGDWAEVGGKCSCGRSLPTLSRILGRERNLVRLPDGRRHWPLVGFQQFGQVAQVRQYQVIQESLSDVELRVVVNTPLSVAQRSELTTIVRTALGFSFNVSLQEFAEPLPRGANGKFEEFVCKVPSDA